MIAVIPDTGAVLARRTRGAKSAKGTFPASSTYPASEQGSGAYVDPIDHVTRIVSYRHIDGYPPSVLVGLLEAEEFADCNHTGNLFLLMTGFISLAMLSFLAVTTAVVCKLLGRKRQTTLLVEHDHLTGLYNRYAILRRLRHDVAQPSSVGRLAILLVDLDNFKRVNDTLGHNAGDVVLQVAGSRLADVVGDASALSRIGGDEFIVIVKGDDVERRAAALAEAAAEVFATPFEVRGSSFAMHASALRYIQWWRKAKSIC